MKTNSFVYFIYVSILQSKFGENSNESLPESEQDKVKMYWTVDECDEEIFQGKIMFCNSLHCGIRGQEEQANLKVSDFVRGLFPRGHLYEGLKNIGIGQLLDKSKRLSVNNSYKRDTRNIFRFPIYPDNMTEVKFAPGNLYDRYFRNIPNTQQRVFCQVRKGKAMRNSPLGKNKITHRMRKVATVLNMKNPEKFRPHLLRAMMVTVLVNDASVSTEEAMVVSRHSSVAA